MEREIKVKINKQTNKQKMGKMVYNKFIGKISCNYFPFLFPYSRPLLPFIAAHFKCFTKKKNVKWMKAKNVCRVRVYVCI